MAFLLVKNNLEAIRGINNEGQSAEVACPRSESLPDYDQEQRRCYLAHSATGLDDYRYDELPTRNCTAPTAPRPPSPKAGRGSKQEGLATSDLCVISPESMALKNNKSRDENSANAALVFFGDGDSMFGDREDRTPARA